MKCAPTEVGIYKRDILRKKRKHAFDQEKKKEIMILIKKKKKTRYLDQKRVIKQHLDQEKKQVLRSSFFSFINSRL